MPATGTQSGRGRAANNDEDFNAALDSKLLQTQKTMQAKQPLERQNSMDAEMDFFGLDIDMPRTLTV